MISLKNKQKGFTIVELLIVIVVIGILAAIVIVTFTGVQKKARDSDRRSDINAVNSLLEVYYADNASYPTKAQLDDKDTWVPANLKDLKADVTTAPGGTTDDFATTNPPTATNVYTYVEAPTGCANTSASPCTGYTLGTALENGGTFMKNSSN